MIFSATRRQNKNIYVDFSLSIDSSAEGDFTITSIHNAAGLWLECFCLFVQQLLENILENGII